MSNPETPETGEPIEGGERTRESETKANVELWKDLGVEVDEADVRAKIEELPEVEGFDFYIYMPDTHSIQKILWEKCREKIQGSNTDFTLDQIRIDGTRERSGAYAIATRYRQELPEGDLDHYRDDRHRNNYRVADEWLDVVDETGDEFMELSEYLILSLRWHRDHGSTLDFGPEEKTMFPTNLKYPRIKGDIFTMGRNNSMYIYIDTKMAGLVRRVITKDTKV